MNTKKKRKKKGLFYTVAVSFLKYVTIYLSLFKIGDYAPY